MRLSLLCPCNMALSPQPVFVVLMTVHWRLKCCLIGAATPAPRLLTSKLLLSHHRDAAAEAAVSPPATRTAVTLQAFGVELLRNILFELPHFLQRKTSQKLSSIICRRSRSGRRQIMFQCGAARRHDRRQLASADRILYRSVDKSQDLNKRMWLQDMNKKLISRWDRRTLQPEPRHHTHTTLFTIVVELYQPILNYPVTFAYLIDQSRLFWPIVTFLIIAHSKYLLTYLLTYLLISFLYMAVVWNKTCVCFINEKNAKSLKVVQGHWIDR